MRLLLPQSTNTLIGHFSFIGALRGAMFIDLISISNVNCARFLVLYLILYVIFSWIFLNFIQKPQPDTPSNEFSISIIQNNNDIDIEIKEEEKEGEEYKEEEEKKQYDPNNNNNSSYKYPAPTAFQKTKIQEIVSNARNKDFFESKEYLDLIPTDKEWISRPLNIKNATRKQHETMLDHFINNYHAIGDKGNKYKKEIYDALKLFNKWRKWRNGTEWKQKAIKEDMRIYSHSVTNEAIDIIKGEGVVFPYSTPIVLGVLLNVYHRRKWDLKLDKLNKFQRCSFFSQLVYVSVKTPTYFIANRDLVFVAFCYPFEDGSAILGSRSILHDEYPPNEADLVRACLNGDFWYLTPDFENNINHTKVSLYSHVSLGGNLPSWLINAVSTDIPTSVLKVRTYMKGVYNGLYKKGLLHIPPYPCLKLLDIDVKWMDRSRYPVQDGEKEIEKTENTNININRNRNRGVKLFEYNNVSTFDSADKIISLLERLSFDMDFALDNI